MSLAAEEAAVSRLTTFAPSVNLGVFDTTESLPEEGGLVFWGRIEAAQVRVRSSQFLNTAGGGRFGVDVHVPTSRKDSLSALCNQIASLFRGDRLIPGVLIDGEQIGPPHQKLRFECRTVVLFYSTLLDHSTGG